jgi:hypothetical protein
LLLLASLLLLALLLLALLLLALLLLASLLLMDQFFKFILSQDTGAGLLPVSLLLLAFLTVPGINSVSGIVSRLNTVVACCFTNYCWHP